MSSIAETNRRRYEALRAAGQGEAAKALPPATALDAVPIAPDAVLGHEEVPAGWYTTVRMRRGEALRIVDTTGHSSVSLIGWCLHDTSERLNVADTAKIQWSAALSKGRVLFTDMGRIFLALIEDTSGAHDLLVGGSTPGSTTGRNTHDNFLAAASKLGLGLRDLHPSVTFFAPVSLDDKGRFHWNAKAKKAGDFVDLRAESDLVVVLSNCAHPLDPTENGPIAVMRHRIAPAAADDFCRTASPEVVRAFEFTDRLHT